ncbi:FAD-dependent oxidoreductase [Limnobacter humi]|uniref:FAD-dependent oxidoreductase n=1 Tax=Limnobacter humi TaxID=1778671 RepID=A0ABT1WFM3_9BURK|nr:FAD-dependent oxidoreductase [Limnobacter humi]MCQ8895851.1 FAD-dependent oxidoreductase [Limnobacter humi]
MLNKRVAIVGAGMSGLACARELVRQGCDVTLYEKSRGPGGRMPTRWLNRDAEVPLGFDHGAQYFQVSNPQFQLVIDQAHSDGAAALWTGRVVDLSYGVIQDHAPGARRWVGTPGMASLGRWLSQGLTLHTQARVVGVMRQGAHYKVTVHLGDGTVRVDQGFDAVVCAIPAEQTRDLFEESHPALALKAAQVKSTVTWTVMLSLQQPLKMDYDGAFVVDSPLGWICRDSAKPGRAPGERWVLQATADWSSVHQDIAPDEALRLLLDVFCNVTGQFVEPLQMTAHRWLYSLPLNPCNEMYYLDAAQNLGACGDWLAGARVEDAFLSGHALANKLLRAWDSALV